MKTYFVGGYVLIPDMGEYDKENFSVIVKLSETPSDIDELKSAIAKTLGTRFKVVIKYVSKL